MDEDATLIRDLRQALRVMTSMYIDVAKQSTPRLIIDPFSEPQVKEALDVLERTARFEKFAL